MSYTRRWICSCVFNLHVRTFSSKSRGFRVTQEDKEAGSDAIFNREIKKMKHKIATDTDMDSDHGQDVMKISQDYTKRGTAMKYARQAKFMGHQREYRSLTWDNIDKIRFLRQENPEEWGITELARSFEVTENTVNKVLKSKFTPDPERRRNQDMLAQQNTGVLEDKSMPSELFPVKDLIGGSDQPASSPGYHLKQKTKVRTRNKDITRDVKEKSVPKDSENPKMHNSLSVEFGSDEWDLGDVQLDAELEEAEEFSSLSPSDFVEAFDKGTAPPKVIQKGREFYDEDGEFLFKI